VDAEVTGVSRATVYKWLIRFENEGEAGLADRSSRPHVSHAKLTPQADRRGVQAAPEAGLGAASHRLGAPHRAFDGLRRAAAAGTQSPGPPAPLHPRDHPHRTDRPGRARASRRESLGGVPPGGGKRMAQASRRPALARTAAPGSGMSSPTSPSTGTAATPTRRSFPMSVVRRQPASSSASCARFAMPASR